MDTRQKDKEKEKEKDLPPGEKTPKVSGVDCEGRPGPADDPYGLVALAGSGIKSLALAGLIDGRISHLGLDFFRTDYENLLDQTWTVVKERYREDSGHEKMCGEWVIIDKVDSSSSLFESIKMVVRSLKEVGALDRL
ncbi:hypothetical protein F2Q68_00020042 [Brassica cretica]|uniref:Uncharacterized protein n=1 Tax=Brassica cretica TaxID=69181 RepID=A0A8S9FRB9_BRACR|nr:hypothetical protein F2Q68_00020042 [Brassica cretica]